MSSQPASTNSRQSPFTGSPSTSFTSAAGHSISATANTQQGSVSVDNTSDKNSNNSSPKLNLSSLSVRSSGAANAHSQLSESPIGISPAVSPETPLKSRTQQSHRDSSGSQYTIKSESSRFSRASMDSTKGGHQPQHMNYGRSSLMSQFPQQALGSGGPPPASPFKGNTTRPASELLPGSRGNTSTYNRYPHPPPQNNAAQSSYDTGANNTPDDQTDEAIEKWFEDLQNYEQTLEDMAAASLDQSFKEELAAIEQWFRVLSEAERTAALYSLLQNASSVQIRFFITVLTQMSRTDPIALLSPTNPQASMESQMEAKMASLGIKSPTSPAVRQFSRQSVGGNHSFLSPNTALYNPQLNDDTPKSGSNILAQHRAKLKSSTHRISAPGHLASSMPTSSNVGHGESIGAFRSKSPWDEKRHSSSSTQRPKSTGSEHNLTGDPLNNGNRGNEDSLSPMPGASWASMVSTPLAPMFEGNSNRGSGDFTVTQDINNAWAGEGSSPNSPSGDREIILDDVRKFRRGVQINSALSASANLANPELSSLAAPQAQYLNRSAPPGGGSQYGDDVDRRPSPAPSNSARSPASRTNSLAATSGNWRPNSPGNVSNNNTGQFNANTSAGLLSPEIAALAAAQNWRNNPTNMNGMNNADTLAIANLLNQQQQQQQQQMQQLQQLQMQQNLGLMNGMGLSLGGVSSPLPVGNMAAGLSNPSVQQLLSASVGSGNGGGIGLNNSTSGFNPMNSFPAGFPGGFGAGIGGTMSSNTVPHGSSSINASQARKSPRMGTSDRLNASTASGKSAANTVSGNGSDPTEPLNMELISDIPAWLRSLRLHKYQSIFESMAWKEMISLDDTKLEELGVSALGARRKLLKVFQNVRVKTGMEAPPEDDAKVETKTEGTSVSEETKSEAGKA